MVASDVIESNNNKDKNDGNLATLCFNGMDEC